MPLSTLMSPLAAGTVAGLFAAFGPSQADTVPTETEVLTTADYLEMPEIFQITFVSGSIAMLQHLSPLKTEIDCACFARWGVSEDVVAVVALHVQRNPDALSAPFADTLLDALTERCDNAE